MKHPQVGFCVGMGFLSQEEAGTILFWRRKPQVRVSSGAGGGAWSQKVWWSEARTDTKHLAQEGTGMREGMRGRRTKTHEAPERGRGESRSGHGPTSGRSAQTLVSTGWPATPPNPIPTPPTHTHRLASLQGQASPR